MNSTTSGLLFSDSLPRPHGHIMKDLLLVIFDYDKINWPLTMRGKLLDDGVLAPTSSDSYTVYEM